MQMLEDFVQKQEINILFLQEVTHHKFESIRGYKAYSNLGKTRRVSEMMTRNEITLKNLTRLPSGRGMAAEYRGICLVYIYTARPEQGRGRREKSFSMGSSPACCGPPRPT
jgi:hypothetical protein